jgi:hypothetical protein
MASVEGVLLHVESISEEVTDTLWGLRACGPVFGGPMDPPDCPWDSDVCHYPTLMPNTRIFDCSQENQILKSPALQLLLSSRGLISDNVFKSELPGGSHRITMI